MSSIHAFNQFDKSVRDQVIKELTRLMNYKKVLIRVETKNFCAGMVLANGVVMKTAPILKPFLRKTLDEVIKEVPRKYLGSLISFGITKIEGD